MLLPLLGDRLTVGRVALDHLIGVRIPVSQPILPPRLTCICTGAFAGNTSAVIFNAILNKTPTSPVHFNPDCPAELEKIVNKLLEKDRRLRYQSAKDILVDLQRLRRSLIPGPQARPAHAPERASRAAEQS